MNCQPKAETVYPYKTCVWLLLIAPVGTLFRFSHIMYYRLCTVGLT